MMKKYILKSIFVLTWLMVTFPAFAFPGDPDGGEDPPFEDPMPIDQNLWILLILALAAGAIFVYRRKIKVV